MAEPTERPAFVLDANVLIDYANSDCTVIKLVSEHIGVVGACDQVLDEAFDFTEDLVMQTGLRVLELTESQLLEAYLPQPALSPQDVMCMIMARDCKAVCVTNEKPLRKACAELDVNVLWGLELMHLLNAQSMLDFEEAMRIAGAIHESNPHHITAKIVSRFSEKLKKR